MDPRDGEVLALGSFPSFDANVFAKPINQETFERLSEENGAPLFNRATTAGYPTGSTFKPITAFAAVDYGLITPTHAAQRPRRLQATPAASSRTRATPSSGRSPWPARSRSPRTCSSTSWARARTTSGAVLQDLGAQLSFGKPTGIDLPGEFDGLVPDAEWRNASTRIPSVARRRRTSTPGTIAALYACGGIERGWSGGDNVNLAVGQGDLQATPLQLAIAYAAIENGGRVVTPHLGHADRGRRRAPARGDPQARRSAGSTSTRRRRDDPRGPARRGRRSRAAPRPTCSPASPPPCYGKTGTAERPPEPGPVLVRGLRARPGEADRRRGHGREGRLRRRDGRPRGAPDPVQVVRGQGRRVPRRDEHR